MTKSKTELPEDNKEMDFLDHLEELRWRLIKCLLTIAVMTCLVFIFSDKILEWLILPTQKLKVAMTIQVLKIQGLLMLKFSIALLGGIALSLPVLVYQIWAFISPGLYHSERRWGVGLILGVTFSFILGAVFAYFVMIPYALEFLINVGAEGIARNISIEYYAKFVMQLLLATGLIFQMPVVAFILTRMGILTPRFMRRYWRYAVMIIVIVAAIITPPDPVSMILMSIPLLLLYEVSIVVSRLALPIKKSQEGDASPLAG